MRDRANLFDEYFPWRLGIGCRSVCSEFKVLFIAFYVVVLTHFVPIWRIFDATVTTQKWTVNLAAHLSIKYVNNV